MTQGCLLRPRAGPWPLTPRSLPQILWTFSIYLESVAILPQLFMISKTGEAETITTHYLFFLGLYRALYLVNWIWRFYFEGFFDLIAVVAGVVQTILYCDFFYLYITKGASGIPHVVQPVKDPALPPLWLRFEPPPPTPQHKRARVPAVVCALCSLRSPLAQRAPDRTLAHEAGRASGEHCGDRK